MTKIDLSIVATFHREGGVVHKTIRNILQLTQPLKAEHIHYEILLHVDNGDPQTLQYLEQYRQHPAIHVFDSHFGSPADSRNFCVQKARGRFLALIDGDDIFSRQWLIDGYHLLNTLVEPAILHAEYDISFGYGEPAPRIWHMTNSRPYEEDIANLFTRNRWDAGIMLPREIALRYPYKSATHGFGYEDWVFNIDTRGGGIPHAVIPNSVKFYRVREESVFNSHGSSHAVTAYSDTFSTPKMQKLARGFMAHKLVIKSPNTRGQKLEKAVGYVSKAGRKFSAALPRIGGFAQRGFNHLDRQRGQKVFLELPQHAQDAWIDANQIDGEAWPDPLKLGRLWYYSSDFNDQTELYCRLISQIRRDPDYLFLPPQLSIGGTEKVITNYINAFAELHPDWHIVVLSSLPDRHPYKIPNNVDFVDFYSLIQGRSTFEVDFILSRFVVQTKVKRLHLIHNELAYLWAKDHLTLLRDNDYKVYISQFMDEYNKDHRLTVGFVDPWIRNILPVVTKIFTDNEPFAKEIVERLGVQKEKVVAHFQPIDAQLATNIPDKPVASQNGEFRILWASRVSPQKRPDLLKQIAQRLNASKDLTAPRYLIDVYGRTQRPYTKRFFANLSPTVTYHGVYNGIEDLDLSQYDAFLYTSQTDGLPNVLLEIASAGLPIVASSIGGVSDIVNKKTGYPVAAVEDIDGYIKALQEIHDEPKKARQKAVQARKIVEARHTWQHFCDQVKRDID